MTENFNDKTTWPIGKRPTSDPEGFKKVLLHYINENPNKSQDKIARAFGLSQYTINRYIKLLGVSYRQKPPGFFRDDGINLSELAKYVAENPDKKLKEIASNFNVSISAICKRLKKMGISRRSKK